VESDEKACPFCAETLKAAAIKRKHCGEMLTQEAERSASATTTAVVPSLVRVTCGYCQTEKTIARTASSFQCTACGRVVLFATCPKCQKVSQVDSTFRSWNCAQCHAKVVTPPAMRNAAYEGVHYNTQKKKTLSDVATRTEDGVPKCPKCRGTQFKVGRKTSTKLLFGAASMLGQAQWVRCVTCGERYRRG